MPKICYRNFRFRPDTMKLIEQANTIVEEYTAQGFDLTLRQCSCSTSLSAAG